MIAKPIEEIEWQDLTALQDAGREEGQQLEYKSSFKGGDDFLGLNEQRKKNAVESLAREVISFLNASGGDLLVGIREVSNVDPRIADFNRLPNIQVVADRVAQSLVSVIEPAQSLISVKAIRDDDRDDGVLLIRVGASLRAPHRSTRSKEAYVRRGREAVPMAMDEIQDMTLSRTRIRTERLELLETQFSDIQGNRIGRSTLPMQRFHIRAAMVPLSDRQIELDAQTLAAADPQDPQLFRGDERERFTVAFRSLDHNWRPVLRGKRMEVFNPRDFRIDDFSFAAREIRENGIFLNEFACLAYLGNNPEFAGLPFAWLIGFASNVFQASLNLAEQHPDLRDSAIRFGIYSAEGLQIEYGSGRFFNEVHGWPAGQTMLPDFEVPTRGNINELFAQIQLDLASIIGVQAEEPFLIQLPE